MLDRKYVFSLLIVENVLSAVAVAMGTVMYNFNKECKSGHICLLQDLHSLYHIVFEYWLLS